MNLLQPTSHSCLTDLFEFIVISLLRPIRLAGNSHVSSRVLTLEWLTSGAIIKQESCAVTSAYICDFLLVINSNLGPIFPRFRDIAGYLLRRATPPLFHPNFGGVPFGLDYRCCGSEERRP